MARIGCAFCFVTLDPHSEAPPSRAVVRCVGERCTKYYHKACWPGKCVGPACQCAEEAKDYPIDPPDPLPVDVTASYPVLLGAAVSLSDQPLGLSTGMIGDVGGHATAVVNNTDQPVRLPRVLSGPPWATIDLYPARPNAITGPPACDDHHTVRPDDRGRELRVHLHPVRPLLAEHILHVGSGQTLVIRSSPVSGHNLAAGMTMFVVLVGWHVVSAVRTSATATPSIWWPSVTFGLVAAYAGWLSLPWVRGGALWFLDRCFGWVDRHLPYARPVARVYAWLADPDPPRPTGTLLRTSALVPVAFVLGLLAYRVLIGSWAIDLLADMTTSTVGFLAAALLYTFAMMVLWSWWLSWYGFFVGRTSVAVASAVGHGIAALWVKATAPKPSPAGPLPRP